MIVDLGMTDSIEAAGERLFIEDFDTWDMTGYYLYSKLLRSGVSGHIGTWGTHGRPYPVNQVIEPFVQLLIHLIHKLTSVLNCINAPDINIAALTAAKHHDPMK